MQRSGTSIGANVTEAEKGQSKADFYAKPAIALKEAYETHDWLRLLHETDYLTDKEFDSMDKDIKRLLGVPFSIRKIQIIPNYTKYNFAFCILHYFSEINHGLV